MNNNLHKKYGFSLAEALITLLIVCLITLASVPVLTKKHKNLSNIPHGEWTCVIDEESGHHISWSQDSPTPVDGGAFCQFIPPARAQNFIIRAVGGGGGGGAGFSEIVRKTVTGGGSMSVDLKTNNKYEITLIGGGGGGGGGNDCGGTAGGGGGGGGLAMFTFYPSSNITYSLKAGSGGNGGAGEGGHSGKSGDPGTDSSFAGTIFAKAGNGGDGRDHLCRTDSGNKAAGGGYHNSDTTGSFVIKDLLKYDGGQGGAPNRGGNGSPGSAKTSLIPYYVDSNTGKGGKGGQGEDVAGDSGRGGYASININEISSGTSGEAGRSSTFPIASITKQMKITIGKGGKGAKHYQGTSSVSISEATKGGSTLVGDLLSADGGPAGKSRANSPSSYNNTFLAGEDGKSSGFGEESSLSLGGRKNGAMDASSSATVVKGYGYSGGGGGAKAGGSFPIYNNVYSGNGADGASGAVIIKW